MSEAGTVAQAHDALESPPHWILLDLMLPDGNGMGVLKAIRAKRLPTQVCLVTGCCADVLHEAQRNAEHTFIKPLDVDRLMSVLGAA